MKWFTAALYDQERSIRPGRESDRVVRGPFDDDEERDREIKRYSREVRNAGLRAIVVPFDVEGDSDTVEVADLEEVGGH